ncbi:MAG: hypothetical protein OXQ89_21910 [Rhodospirillaceae bacterium]|nr:hypothetical protein [Rhodospirillaceae bacterium]MDE0360749.1 hypothetical protein [Rhodospirillaceae bacterium]
MDDQRFPHRVHLTEEHYHMARQFMVSRRLRSARVAVEKMIEIVSEWETEKEREKLLSGGKR